MVDALVLGTSTLGCESSSLSPSTINIYTMPKLKKKEAKKDSPRIAHVDFYVEKERTFVKYVKYLSSPMHIMWRNFLVGAFQGLGFALGTALILSVIGFITSKILVEIPFFSDFGQAINIWLDHTLNMK